MFTTFECKQYGGRAPSLCELIPMVFNRELTHLGSEASIPKLINSSISRSKRLIWTLDNQFYSLFKKSNALLEIYC